MKQMTSIPVDVVRAVLAMNRPSRTFKAAFIMLRWLNEHPNSSRYAIEKQCRLDRPTVYRATEALLRSQFVKVTSESKLGTGLMKKGFAVTKNGSVALSVV